MAVSRTNNDMDQHAGWLLCFKHSTCLCVSQSSVPRRWVDRAWRRRPRPPLLRSLRGRPFWALLLQRENLRRHTHEDSVSDCGTSAPLQSSPFYLHPQSRLIERSLWWRLMSSQIYCLSQTAVYQWTNMLLPKKVRCTQTCLQHRPVWGSSSLL